MKRSTLTAYGLLLAVAAGCSFTTDVDAEDGPAAASKTVAPVQSSARSALPQSGDWPRWRGPRSDGISTETGWQAQWPKAGPKQLWSAEVGIGFSSVSVSQGRLYTLGHRSGNETVYCFDAAGGSELWNYSYPCKLVDHLHEGGPAATPTVDADRVYTLSKEGHLFCLDAQGGEVLWAKQLPELTGVEMPEWGFSCSPLVEDQMLVVEAGRTIALNKTTGEMIWKTEPFRPGYGSPVAFQAGGQSLIAVLNNDCLLVVRARDGSEVDRYPWKTHYAASATTPIIHDNTIFFSTGYGRGCTLLKLENGKLKRVYENRNIANHMNNCVLWEGYLYGFDGNANNRRLVTLVCMDHATGDVQWEQRGLGCGSLMVADGKLIVLGDDGELVTASPSADKFEEISRATVLDDRCWTVPVLSNSRIYCRNARGKLVCLDVGG